MDDHEAFRAQVREVLGRSYQLTEAASEEQFRHLYQPYRYALVILDMRLRTGREGLDLLREVYALDELQPTIMVSAYGDTESTIEALESGALMFLNKAEFTPGLIARVVEAVMHQGRMKRQLAVLEGRLGSELASDLVGMSPGIIEVARRARQASNDPGSTVMILGEPGTGRTLTARVIHDRSPIRTQGPFVTVTPDVLRASDVQISLFGRELEHRLAGRKGLLEQAQGGVFFVEELAGCPDAVLAGILDAIGQKRLPLGGSETMIPFDSQLLIASSAATTASNAAVSRVAEAMPASRVIEIYLPPLRERPEDLALLVPYFVQDMHRRGAATASRVSRRVLDLFGRYRWPGNVRELKTVLEYAAIRAMGEDSDEILPRYLPLSISDASNTTIGETGGWDYRLHLATAELGLAEGALAAERSKTKAELAALLGYNDRFTFQRRLRRHLASYPQLKAKFPRVAGLFRTASRS